MIVVHCSAVKPGQTSSAKQIDGWHKTQGWKGIGYHYVVRRNGSVEHGRQLREVGAHVAKHNRYSVGVCYEGGYDENGKEADTRTPKQKVALRKLLEELHERFPRAVIVGHHDLDPIKPCPCFDAVKEYGDLQPK